MCASTSSLPQFLSLFLVFCFISVTSRPRCIIATSQLNENHFLRVRAFNLICSCGEPEVIGAVCVVTVVQPVRL